MADSEQIERAIRDRFPEAVEETTEIGGVPTLYVRADEIATICDFLKQDSGLDFDYLTSLTAVDWPDRLDVVYHLYSITYRHHATLKVKVDRHEPVVPSVTSVWKAANWQEREVYDMFGIRFGGHPDLTRILLDQDWEGFPMRKDYTEK